VVCVDSSVWIDFFRAKDDALVEELRRLLGADQVALAAPVRLELLSGLPRAGAVRLRRLLSALPLLVPEPPIWSKLEAWLEQAQRSGQRFDAMDLLIAGIADAHNCAVWSLDSDFERMARLGWVTLHHVA
jgi:predicted nucleic acid-binding protein